MAADSRPPAGKLPDAYDELIAVERLVHGKHNPRRVTPKAELRDSIAKDGLQQPLIVWFDADADCYQITDGWQRYQAATDLGWERLPVSVAASPLAALTETETASIVREWGTYEWAQYCRSIGAELEVQSDPQRAAAVAARTTRCPQTVRKYLDALSLPDVAHPLLVGGPDGDEQVWAALKNHNDDVRQYNGLPWPVGARLGKRADADGLARQRTIAIAANAVEYDCEDALRFVELAVDAPTLPVETVHMRLRQEATAAEPLTVPRVLVSMSEAEQQAIMEYCAETRQSLSEVVETQLQTFAAEQLE